MENGEQTTSLDALDASLGDLLKAASRITGEPLNKGGDGVSIDNSGTTGSDGKQGGGQGSMSDAGKVEDLMIGKLTAAGFNAAQASSIVGMMKDVGGGSFFSHTRPSPTGGKGGEMTGKARKPPVPPFAGAADDDFGGDDEGGDDEGDGDEDDEAGGPAMRGKRRMGKSASFDEQFRADPDIGEVVDVSPFMETLTARTTEALDSLNKSLRKSVRRSDEQFALLAKSTVALGTLVKAQQGVISEMGRRLGVVERQPAPQKGVTALSGTHQPMNKSMPNEAGAGGSTLRKSEVASVLTYMHLEKGMKEIGGRKIATELVPLVESSGEVPANIVGEVQNFLRRNPGEANLAKSYA